MQETLPGATIRAAQALFHADRHHPGLEYSDDCVQAIMFCVDCSAAIIWQITDGEWKSDLRGYRAGRRCVPVAQAPRV